MVRIGNSKPSSPTMKLLCTLGFVVLATAWYDSRADALVAKLPTMMPSTTRAADGRNGKLFVSTLESDAPSTSRLAMFREARTAIQAVSEQRSISPSTAQERAEAGAASLDPLWCSRTKQLGQYQQQQRKHTQDAAFRKMVDVEKSLPSTSTSRRAWLHSMIVVAVATNNGEKKQYNLPDEQLAKIIVNDIIEKKALVTADITRSIYDEYATFKDGSDLDGRYFRDQWVRGCRMLFRASECQARLIPGTLQVTRHDVTFRYEEDLTFRGPFSPKCFLSGTVIMKRCPKTGLIKSYEEIWDKGVSDIVKSAKLQGSNRLTDLFMARIRAAGEDCI